MTTSQSPSSCVGVVRRLLPVLFALAFTLPASAQGDGPRSYWKSLAGSNAVTFWPVSASGNFNPLDPANVINPDASFEADIVLLGYHKVLPLFGRSSTVSFLLPVGNLGGEVSGVSLGSQEAASGFGDPMLQLNLNLIGAPAITNLPEVMRYEPDFTLDLLVSLGLPLGEYESTEPLNMGQNRWYGRIGMPLMWTFGPWVPGQRTTLEVLPTIWMFDDNDDLDGRNLETDPIFGLEAHLTRDFTESFWASVDVANFSGGESSVDGLTGSEIDNLGLGLTFGFQINENLQVAASYFSTISDSGPNDLHGDEMRIMFTYGWHPLVEGMHRLQGGE